ncbi:hypothetical protein B0H14DRAFT_2644421 [Mycena olivaceomarginata]|nr:hypothetical protein B0H14DRAFT_2644421 [Mycena olivaceomarginata]
MRAYAEVFADDAGPREIAGASEEMEKTNENMPNSEKGMDAPRGGDRALSHVVEVDTRWVACFWRFEEETQPLLRAYAIVDTSHFNGNQRERIGLARSVDSVKACCLRACELGRERLAYACVVQGHDRAVHGGKERAPGDGGDRSAEPRMRVHQEKCDKRSAQPAAAYREGLCEGVFAGGPRWTTKFGGITGSKKVDEGVEIIRKAAEIGGRGLKTEDLRWCKPDFRWWKEARTAVRPKVRQRCLFSYLHAARCQRKVPGSLLVPCGFRDREMSSRTQRMDDGEPKEYALSRVVLEVEVPCRRFDRVKILSESKGNPQKEKS